MQLVLIRHGRSVMNDLGRIQGQTCAGLSPAGKEQAELIGSHLSQRLAGPVRIVASDLERAMDTARPLADRLGIEVQPDSRFRERSCGRWEQAAPEELKRAEPALWARWQAGEDVLPEVGGESETALVARVVPAIEEVLAATMDDATLVLVSHGGPCFYGAHALLGYPPGLLARPSNASISSLDRRGDLWRVRTWNEIAHLRTGSG